MHFDLKNRPIIIFTSRINILKKLLNRAVYIYTEYTILMVEGIRIPVKHRQQ